MNSDNAPPDPVPRPWQPRFGLGSLMLAMLVCSATAAAGYYLVQALHGGRQSQLAFILFTLASPVLLLVLVSSALAVVRWRERGRR